MPDIFVAEKKESPENKPISHPTDHTPVEKIKKITEKDLEPEISEKHMSAFSTYCVNPSGVSFADQEKDEKILLFLRRHIITNLDWILIALGLSLIPVILSVISILNPLEGNFLEFLNFPPQFTMLFLIFYYSLIFTYILVNFISWFYNIGLVTSLRVVDIDLNELILKNIATTKHSLIQDVSYAQNGAIRSLFNFGDVIVQTAGQEGKFELEAVPHPDKVVHLMEDFIGKKREP